MNQEKYSTDRQGVSRPMQQRATEITQTIQRLIRICDETIERNEAGIKRCERALGVKDG